MSTFKKVFNSLVLTSSAIVLCACGGGGGSGGDGGTGTAPAAANTPVTITAANAPNVAGTTFDVSDSLAGGGGVSNVLTASVGGRPTTDTRVIDALITQIKQTPVLFEKRTAGVSPAAVVQITNEPCDSGTFSGSINDADNDQNLSSGDSFTITTNNCNFSGTVMNGSMLIDNLVIGGGFINDIAPYTFSARLQATNLSITDNGETVVMNGDATLSESSNDGITTTSRYSGNGTNLVFNGDTLTLSDYAIDAIVNNATGAYTLSLNGAISSASIGGSVTVTTTVPFTGVGNFDPTAGEATCVGANNTSVTLIANSDGLTVQLLVDGNGDGIDDDTLAEAWATL